ncbi:unnamed protein product [Nippostrongylus brasiliensis]|uniref:BTB/POZ domain-containing protein n=1 Tax=Nippostrongylus brasiliensis TaxID=27835 RepID=A0A0N4YM85_NIPBR|nr:unnamed protein product [Nippostrongylus brasiliensis]
MFTSQQLVRSKLDAIRRGDESNGPNWTSSSSSAESERDDVVVVEFPINSFRFLVEIMTQRASSRRQSWMDGTHQINADSD